jgi:hypothetical protein
VVFPWQRVEWISGLPPATCVERLRALRSNGRRAQPGGLSSVSVVVAYQGRLPGGTHVTLFCRPTVAGTSISGRFVPGPFAHAFIWPAVWGIGVAGLFLPRVGLTAGTAFLAGFARSPVGVGVLFGAALFVGAGMVTCWGWRSQCAQISQDVARVCEASRVLKST